MHTLNVTGNSNGQIPEDKWLKRPKPPCCRIVMDYSVSGYCKLCHSSLQRRFKWIGHIFGIGKVIGCIQPECDNYYGKHLKNKLTV